MMEEKSALIAMSGGVDSSVAALLTRDAGYRSLGCTMRLYRNEESGSAEESRDGRTCCSLDDTEDARSVARKIGIPYQVFNYTDEFKKRVTDRFAAAYGAHPAFDLGLGAVESAVMSLAVHAVGAVIIISQSPSTSVTHRLFNLRYCFVGHKHHNLALCAFLGFENAHVLHPYFLGHLKVHATHSAVHIGVSAIDSNIMLNCLGNNSFLITSADYLFKSAKQ